MRKRRNRIGTVLLSVLALTVITLLGLICYKQYLLIEQQNKIEGLWAYEMDLSKTASEEAYKFLSGANGISLSKDDVEEAMKDVKVKVSLEFTEDKRHFGTYKETLLKEDYDAAFDLAYEKMASLMAGIMEERLTTAGIELSTEEFEKKIVETFDMPLKEYFEKNGPVLLENFDDLNVRINRSGEYEASDGKLVRYFMSVPYESSFSKTDNVLMIEDYVGDETKTYIYQKVHSDDADIDDSDAAN